MDREKAKATAHRYAAHSLRVALKHDLVHRWMKQGSSTPDGAEDVTRELRKLYVRHLGHWERWRSKHEEDFDRECHVRGQPEGEQE